jgi:hypothetical protein
VIHSATPFFLQTVAGKRLSANHQAGCEPLDRAIQDVSVDHRGLDSQLVHAVRPPTKFYPEQSTSTITTGQSWVNVSKCVNGPNG